MKAFSEVDIDFVLFEFVVALLRETMMFYWIIWRPHNGDLMGITLHKFSNICSKVSRKRSALGRIAGY